MIDYIKRADALKAMDCGYLHKGIVDALQSLILEVPAADVRPIMRGEWKTAWLDHEAFGKRPMVFYCSACNQIITFRTLFCPNCGADMRKKEEELDER